MTLNNWKMIVTISDDVLASVGVVFAWTPECVTRVHVVLLVTSTYIAQKRSIPGGFLGGSREQMSAPNAAEEMTLLVRLFNLVTRESSKQGDITVWSSILLRGTEQPYPHFTIGDSQQYCLSTTSRINDSEKRPNKKFRSFCFFDNFCLVLCC